MVINLTGMDFFEKAKQFDIILGSQSPRRRALLADTGIPFRCLVRETTELFPENMEPEAVALYLCREKARPFADELQRPSVILITADTIVVNRGAILNKPGSEEEAFAMLKTLSGRRHLVITGVCIGFQDARHAFAATTEVVFRELDDWEISHYIREYKPFDKAGAYGIQEWIGGVGIAEIRGSYANVVGLPVERVFSGLKKIIDPRQDANSRLVAF
jgi:septum formation protein